ncbi:MAG: potassium-transporting ATPase subunit F [Candidatus Delongbacteria bacterium]
MNALSWLGLILALGLLLYLAAALLKPGWFE